MKSCGGLRTFRGVWHKIIIIYFALCFPMPHASVLFYRCYHQVWQRCLYCCWKFSDRKSYALGFDAVFVSNENNIIPHHRSMQLYSLGKFGGEVLFVFSSIAS